MYKEIKKTKISRFTLLSFVVPSCLILFVIYFSICVFTHIKYIGDEPTTLFGTVFVFFTPAILTIISIYIISIFVFSKQYIKKRELSIIKDWLAHISVFTIIFANTIEKFYAPKQNLLDETKNYNWFLKQIFDFLYTSIQTINLTYTLPLLFSMLTIILLSLEHTKFVGKSTRRIMVCPSTYPSYNPDNIKVAERIIHENNSLRKSNHFNTIRP